MSWFLKGRIGTCHFTPGRWWRYVALVQSNSGGGFSACTCSSVPILLITTAKVDLLLFCSRVQNVSSTGSTESHRVRLNLTIQATKIEFSSAAAPAGSGSTQESNDQDNPSAALHISGPVTSENPHARLGAFHTLDIEANRDVRIEKADGWDSIAVARVEESIIPGKGAEVGAIVCGEGTAAFCLLSQHMTLVTHRISVPIPRKSASSGSSQHDKGLQKFYQTLYDSFLRHIPYANANLRAIVIASPGWVRDAVYDFITSEASKKGDKMLTKAMKEKCLKVHISSPHVHSLVEVLKSPEVCLKALTLLILTYSPRS